MTSFSAPAMAMQPALSRHATMQHHQSLCHSRALGHACAPSVPAHRSARQATQQHQHQHQQRHAQRPRRPRGLLTLARALQPEQQDEQQQQEQQQLHDAMLRLQALEEYRELLAAHSSSSNDSSSTSSTTTPRTPESVARAIAADDTADDVPLLHAAVLIARHSYPRLRLEHVSAQLDSLAAEVEAGLAGTPRYPLRVLREITRVLYEVHGLKGNSSDYYDPDNSAINRVLDRRTGIPITLSLVYMEVAARVGLRMQGVPLPAHFMIKPEGLEWLVDAFNGGELIALQDAEAVLTRLTGMDIRLDPAFLSADAPPMSCRTFLLRMLNNLRLSYVQNNMAAEALAIIRYMQATAPPGLLPELARDEGLCLYALGRWADATEVLTAFLAGERGPAPDARDAALVQDLLSKVQARAAAAAAEAAAAAAEAAAEATAAEQAAARRRRLGSSSSSRPEDSEQEAGEG